MDAGHFMSAKKRESIVDRTYIHQDIEVRPYKIRDSSMVLIDSIYTCYLDFAESDKFRYHIPRSCFFFTSYSSSVIAPMSNSCLNLMISSAGSEDDATLSLLMGSPFSLVINSKSA